MDGPSVRVPPQQQEWIRYEHHHCRNSSEPGTKVPGGLPVGVSSISGDDLHLSDGRSEDDHRPVRFRDRKDAGRQLAVRLESVRGPDVVVLGLPRGGVPVAAEVATTLGAPLDVIVVRKLGVPGQRELAMGAVGEGGVRVMDERVLRVAHVPPEEVARIGRRERDELDEYVQLFRGGRPPLALPGRVAVIVDDGIATGSTARAACSVARALGAARVVLAAPVCARESARSLASDVDELVCLHSPRHFSAVGQFYDDFRPTQDEEVIELLERARRG
jgi:putative phosphoribosyl transferase